MADQVARRFRMVVLTPLLYYQLCLFARNLRVGITNAEPYYRRTALPLLNYTPLISTRSLSCLLSPETSPSLSFSPA
jgi:hypothetical protein